MNRFLLFTRILLLLIDIVRNINLDTKLFTELVDPRTLGTNDATNILPVDVKLGELEYSYK